MGNAPDETENRYRFIKMMTDLRPQASCRECILPYNKTGTKQIILARIESMFIDLNESEALHLWHDVTIAQVLDNIPDLTVRQDVVLLIIYPDYPPHTVRGLTARLNITRVPDAMRTMEPAHGKHDPQDCRNMIIQRAVEGTPYLKNMLKLSPYLPER